MTSDLPSPLHHARPSAGRGRPYPAPVLAALRDLVEGQDLAFNEIAARTGITATTVARWARRHRWRRPADGAKAPGPAEAAATPRRSGPYGPSEHEAARALIEGTRLSLEQIELRLGISSLMLFRWCKRFRWNRPARPNASGLQLPRYRRRGRPFAADATDMAQRLATTTSLSQARIAAQVVVSQATISAWIRQRGWERPPVRRGAPGYAAARRAAALVAAAETGRRRGRGYGPNVVAEARRLVETTELPTALLAARLAISVSTLRRWTRRGGWTRPDAMPDPHGRVSRRRRRRRST